MANITNLFQPTRQISAGVVRNQASLLSLLDTVTGVTLMNDSQDASLLGEMRRTDVAVTSTFVPRERCAAAAEGTGTGQGKSSGALSETPGFEEPLTAPTPGSELIATTNVSTADLTPAQTVLTAKQALETFRGELLGVGDRLARLAERIGEPAAEAATSTRASTQAGQTQNRSCWQYQSTTHGPIGLYRSTRILRIQASGRFETLGGVKQIEAGVDYLMYLDYRVNTFLNGQPAWIFDEKTKTDIFQPAQTLPAARNCKPPTCSSDVVTNTLRVVVNFKKLILFELNASGSTVGSSAEIRAKVTSLTEEAFTGTASFTHTISASS